MFTVVAPRWAGHHKGLIGPKGLLAIRKIGSKGVMMARHAGQARAVVECDGQACWPSAAKSTLLASMTGQQIDFRKHRFPQGACVVDVRIEVRAHCKILRSITIWVCVVYMRCARDPYVCERDSTVRGMYVACRWRRQRSSSDVSTAAGG